MNKYILVSWPEIQDFMVNKKLFEKCVFVNDINLPTSYMVPEDLYKKVTNKK